MTNSRLRQTDFSQQQHAAGRTGKELKRLGRWGIRRFVAQPMAHSNAVRGVSALRGRDRRCASGRSIQLTAFQEPSLIWAESKRDIDEIIQ